MISDLFPWWAGWLAPVYLTSSAFCASALIGNLSARLALLGWRRHADDAWHERARRLAIARKVVGSNLVVLPLLFLTATLLFAGPISRLPPFALGSIVWLAATCGAIMAGFPVARRAYGSKVPRGYWMSGVLAFVVLFYPAAILTVLLSLALPDKLNSSAAVALGVGLCLLLACYLGGTLPLARALGVLRPPTSRLESIVRRTSERVGVSPKGLWIMVSPMSNAVVFPATKTLCVTTAALESLDDDELEAIVAHELGHVSEGRSAIATRASIAVALTMWASMRPMIGTFGILALPVILIVAFLWINLVARFARRMEVRADTYGKQYQGDEGTYARALERIHRANLMPPVLGKRRAIHPELYDRMVAAGVTPDYPKPRPPSRLGSSLIGVLSIFVTILAVAALWIIPRSIHQTAGRNASPLVWAAALTGGSETQLAALASLRLREGDQEGGLRMLRAASGNRVSNSAASESR